MAKTHIARVLDAADEKVQYDEHVKNVLSNKKILAWILKDTVQETKTMSIADIKDCIGEDMNISSIFVDQGMTNKPREVLESEAILGDNLENKVAYEGSLLYDIRFHLHIPNKENERIKLLINLEAQKDYKQAYDFATRGIFYAARMISAQKDVEFTNSNYQDIKKVYSIWILMNTPDIIGNMISEYTMNKRDVGGISPDNVTAYDKLSVLLVYLNQKKDQEGQSIFHLLNTLLSSDKPLREKEKVLRETFEIETEYPDGIGEEIAQMCNLSEAIEERGIEKGIERGVEALIATCISLGVNQKITKEKLIEGFQLSEEDAQQAIKRYWR